MKKIFLFSLLLLIPLMANAQEKYFHDLKGMEDSEGVTQLFYRIYDLFIPDPYYSYGDYQNHVYHFNTHTAKDSIIINSSRPFYQLYVDYEISDSYIFLDKDINKPFRVTYYEGDHGMDYTNVRGYNGSFFNADFNKIYSIYQTQVDSSKILAVNFETKSAFITLKSDSLPSKYYYTRLAKRSEPEENCEYDPEKVCILGASDSVKIYDYNTLAFESDDDSILFFQRNDSLFTSAVLGDTMTLKNATIPWSGISSIQKISDSGHLLTQTDTRQVFLEERYDIDSSAVYISDDFEGTWYNIFSDTNHVYTTSEYNNLIVYIGSGTTIYHFDSNGMDGFLWIPNPPTVFYKTEHEITGLYKKPNSDILYVLTKEELFIIDDGVKSTLKTLPVSNELEPNSQPNEITLFQNYPNPFNPSTIISYQLPVSGLVKLDVFDMLGRKVATLIDGRTPAGLHEVTFNAQGLSSGMYFYRLETNGITATKRLTVIK